MNCNLRYNTHYGFLQLCTEKTKQQLYMHVHKYIYIYIYILKYHLHIKSKSDKKVCYIQHTC